MRDEPSKPRDEKAQSSEAYRLAGAGFDFFLMLIVPAGLGYWLDRKFDTSPWLVLGGVVFGFVAGLVSLIRLSNKVK